MVAMAASTSTFAISTYTSTPSTETSHCGCSFSSSSASLHGSMKNKKESLSCLSSNLALKSQETVYLHLQCYGKRTCSSKKFQFLVKAEEDSEDDEGVRKVLTPLQKQQLAFALTKKKSVEELYKIRVERKASDERLKELGVERWLRWGSGGSCTDFVDYLVDEQLYILKGEMHVKPFVLPIIDMYFLGDLDNRYIVLMYVSSILYVEFPANQVFGEDLARSVICLESDRAAIFKKGDLVRFPKWMVATVDYIGEYEQRYRYLAYGDDN